MTTDRFRRTFLLLLLAGVSVLFLSMVRAFLLTILLAAIFSALLQPLYRWFERRLRGRRTLASFATLLVFLLGVVGPLLGFFGIVTSEALRISESVAPWVERQIREPSELLDRLSGVPGIERLEPYRDEILTKVGSLVSSLGRYVFQALSATTRGTVSFLFQFFIMLYCMFFFIKDGDKFLRRILYFMPLEHDDELRMLEKFVSVSRATLKGTLVIGILQGALAGLGLALAGIEGWVFWATVMTLLSIIPGVGVALVWVPAAIYLLAIERVVAGVLLIVWCALVVGSVDNLLRPRLVGRDVKMHDLLILFSTLGGLAMFGFAGFIVGPILAAVFVTIWDIYGVVFRDVLPKVGSLNRGSRSS